MKADITTINHASRDDQAHTHLLDRHSVNEGRLPDIDATTRSLVDARYIYTRVGHDSRIITFEPDGRIGEGAGCCEQFWAVTESGGLISLEIWSDSALTCRLSLQPDGAWIGRWLEWERMPIRVSWHEPLDRRINASDILVAQQNLENLLRSSRRHCPLKRALELLNESGAQTPVIVYIGVASRQRGILNEQAGMTVLAFARYADEMHGRVYAIDSSQHHVDTARRMTAVYYSNIQYQVADYKDFLKQFGSGIDLLYLDLDNADEIHECFEALHDSPRLLVIPDLSIISDGAKRSFVERLKSEGYSLVDVTNQQACFAPGRHGTSVTHRSIDDVIARSCSEKMFTKRYIAKIISHDRGDFQSVQNANVLVYWPHGFGDWVFLSVILPLLECSNRYWVTRFGDDTTALFERSSFAAPMYCGTNSPHCSDGGDFRNAHFGLRYDDCDGRWASLQLPTALYRACDDQEIDCLLWSSNPETHGETGFPFHTKGRGVLRDLARCDEALMIRLAKPLPSSISFEVDAWVTRWVEARLQSFGGFGERKLCIISRNGYTGIDKNWGHIAREDMPAGKQREGEECRDFMRLMLTHDRKWMFLLMEDTLAEGDDTLRSEDLHAYSYAQLFTSPAGGAPPFALVLKALINLAELAVGVPTGPYHLAMVKPELPTVGIWIAHLPDWYDEPKSNAVHLVSRNVVDRGFDRRPGSNIDLPDYCHKKRFLGTRVVNGTDVLDAAMDVLRG